MTLVLTSRDPPGMWATRGQQLQQRLRQLRRAFSLTLPIWICPVLSGGCGIQPILALCGLPSHPWWWIDTIFGAIAIWSIPAG